MKKQHIIHYFKNLDGLRFWAAFAVILGHCQQTVFDYEGYRPYEPYANKLASFGVDFFFVLSGFLISNLLITEIEKTGSINIRNFYYRRMLRIFPLYFLIGLIGIFTGQYWLKWFDYLSLFNEQYIQYSYNFKDFLVNLSFLFTFSINFQTLLGYQNPVSSIAVGHFWSLGIEEQFYLLFAPILYLLRNHIWIVLLGFISTGFYFYHTHENFFVGYPNYSYYFTAHRFLFFGAGGALAFFLRYFSLSMIINYISSPLNNPKVSSVHLNSGFLNPPLLQKILNRKSFIYVILGIQLYLLVQAMLYLFGIKFTSIESNSIIDILVALLIIVVAIADYSVIYILGLETKFFKYLGKISYGIYIFHVFSIFLAYNLLKNIGLKDSNTHLFYSVFLFLSLGISVGLATLSFHFFEIHFLKLKLKFQASK